MRANNCTLNIWIPSNLNCVCYYMNKFNEHSLCSNFIPRVSVDIIHKQLNGKIWGRVFILYWFNFVLWEIEGNNLTKWGKDFNIVIWTDGEVPFFTTMWVVELLANDPILLGRSIWLFWHLEHQNPSLISDFQFFQMSGVRFQDGCKKK